MATVIYSPEEFPNMTTSSNGNIFRVTGHLCGEFTGLRWIPHTKASTWRGALMFSLICTRINGWVNNGEAGDLRRYRAHYDVIVMIYTFPKYVSQPLQIPMFLRILPSPFNVFQIKSQICCTVLMLPSPSVHQTRSPVHVFPVSVFPRHGVPRWKEYVWGLGTLEHFWVTPRYWGTKRPRNVGIMEYLIM